MAGINYVFDATQHTPAQMGGIVPVGRYEATISHTEIKSTKDQGGGMFIVTFATEFGSIPMRYNLWNNSQKAVDIAHKQLSALCHAVSIFQVPMNNEGANLRGARCQIEVGKQNAESEYTEIKHVYCLDGSEPGKAVAVAAPQAAPAMPQQQWNNGAGQGAQAFTQAPAGPTAPSQPAFQQAPAQAPQANQTPAWSNPVQAIQAQTPQAANTAWMQSQGQVPTQVPWTQQR
jgi:hypothetical protein